MTTAVRTDLYALITETQAEIRECEKSPRAGTLRTLIERLEAFPGDELSGEAFAALHQAVRVASGAITSPETSALVDLAYESEVMYREGPEESAQDEPTFAVVVRLTAMCHARFAGLSRTDLCKAPWERSYRKGVAALGVLMEEIADAPEWNAHRVEATMLAFEADVRRAIAYRALYAARDALVKVAETAGLFVIGGRQPVRGLEGRGWVRRIGNALWQFEVTEARPLEKARGGLIVATLVAPGAAKERHALPRRFEYGPHRAAEDAALERI